MKPVRIVGYVVVLSIFIVLQSCGSSNTGGTVLFETVNATASVDSAKNPLLSDLATWTGTPCGATSTFSVKNDLVNFNVATTVSIKNGTSSPLILQRATITFTPADSITPALPALYSPTYQSMNYSIPAGGTLSVPVEVANHLVKEFLGSALVCTNSTAIYTYSTTITFDAVEANTGKSGAVTAMMTVRFADFAD